MKKVIAFLLPALLLVCFFVFSETAHRVSGDPVPYLNLHDSVRYVGMATCRSCHADIHATYVHTGMGRSFDHASMRKSAAEFGPHAVVHDSLRDLYYFPFFKNDTSLYVLEYRLENGDTTHRRLEKISYIIGSGQHTNSHILDINGYIYQAPVTYYTQERRWDLAPGFLEDNPRFGRWLTDECISCHNHFPSLEPGSLHKFSDMPSGIECERCHGPGQLHVLGRLEGNLASAAGSPDFTIVNPRRLPRDLQMDLCQRCHLQGVAVLNEGKTFFDFKPGMRLNDVMNVFLPRFTDSHEHFIMASQADRLRLSACFTKSEELTCLTCHTPHRSIEVTPADHYNNDCKNCHSQQPQKSCTAPAARREAVADNCAKCHMPKSGSVDIPHVTITDHWIAAGTRERTATTSPPQFLGIQILTKENPSPLDMARGYLATHDKYLAATLMLDSAAHYLRLAKNPLEERLPVLVHLLFLRENYDSIISLGNRLSPAQLPPDGWTAYRIGEAHFRTGNHEQALRYFQSALDVLPLHLDFMEKKGAALVHLGKLAAAKTVFENVLSENPKRPVALSNLGYLHLLTGNTTEAARLYDLAIALDPDYEQALLNKAALLLLQQKNAEARKLLQQVLKRNPQNRQAREGLMGMGAGR